MVSQICKEPLLRVPMMCLHSQYEERDKFSAPQQLKYHNSIRAGAIRGRLTSAACDAALPKASIAMAQVPGLAVRAFLAVELDLATSRRAWVMDLLKRIRMSTG